MAAAEVGFVAVSRVVVSYAADLVAGVERRVVGDGNVRTAQGNAWAAICADRARAQARAELDAMVATLAARPSKSPAPNSTASSSPASNSTASRGRDQRAVGSSPRSKASQAALVSTR